MELTIIELLDWVELVTLAEIEEEGRDDES